MKEGAEGGQGVRHDKIREMHLRVVDKDTGNRVADKPCIITATQDAYSEGHLYTCPTPCNAQVRRHIEMHADKARLRAP